MKSIKKLPKDFFTRSRDNVKKSKNNDYSKIEEITWNKDILNGKKKLIGCLPTNK